MTYMECVNSTCKERLKSGDKGKVFPLNEWLFSNFMYNNTQSANTNIKSGRERIGNPEHSNVYVCWPQQCVFIGADRRRVKYEDLTQSQWTAGLTTMAAQETNPQIQRNMFLFIASRPSGHLRRGF